jgi:hypothetical protein
LTGQHDLESDANTKTSRSPDAPTPQQPGTDPARPARAEQGAEHGYRALAQAAFDQVESVVRRDILRVPYTHCIMNCRRRSSAPE